MVCLCFNVNDANLYVQETFVCFRGCLLTYSNLSMLKFFHIRIRCTRSIDCARTQYNVETQEPIRLRYASNNRRALISKKSGSEPSAIRIGCWISAKYAVALHSRHQLPPRTKSSAATTPFSCENCHGLRSLDTPILCVVLDPSKIHSSVFVVVLFSASPFCIWHSQETSMFDICIFFCF